MLVIQNGEDKSIQVGVLHSEAKKQFEQLINLFTMYPTEIHIYNKTKTCKVYAHVKDNRFNIMIENPEDETFKL